MQTGNKKQKLGDRHWLDVSRRYWPWFKRWLRQQTRTKLKRESEVIDE